jgi:hypothetical protein
MRSLCDFLGIGFKEDLLKPYNGNRMTAGSPGRFNSLGDPNFNNHQEIDSSLAESWKNVPIQSLSFLGQQLAAELRYELR